MLTRNNRFHQSQLPADCLIDVTTTQLIVGGTTDTQKAEPAPVVLPPAVVAPLGWGAGNRPPD